jgi:hypothetical protein
MAAIHRRYAAHLMSALIGMSVRFRQQVSDSRICCENGR